MLCRGLIIVGSPRTLYSDPTWKQWLDWIRERQAVAKPEVVYTHAVDLPQQQATPAATDVVNQVAKTPRRRLGNRPARLESR